MANVSGHDESKFGGWFLKDIVEWVASEFEPGDVYSEDVLKEYVRENYEPEDVFKDSDLEYWAESNSYVLEE